MLVHYTLHAADSLDVIRDTTVGVRPLPQSLAVQIGTAILICTHKQAYTSLLVDKDSLIMMPQQKIQDHLTHTHTRMHDHHPCVLHDSVCSECVLNQATYMRGRFENAAKYPALSVKGSQVFSSLLYCMNN